MAFDNIFVIQGIHWGYHISYWRKWHCNETKIATEEDLDRLAFDDRVSFVSDELSVKIYASMSYHTFGWFILTMPDNV